MMNRLSLLDRMGWWAAVAAVMSVPWIVSAVLLSRHGMTWQDITPFTQTESDELFYWHQAGSFWVAGFHAGYYTVSEQPAAAAWTPYYAWGPFVPALYGTLAHLFGWWPHSMTVYNLAALSAGVLAFAWLARPTLFGLSLLGAILAVYSPLLIFYAVSMLPVLELGLGLTAAGLLYWHFQRPRGASLVVVTVVVLLFALLRGTWAFVLLPLFVVTAWPAPRRVALYGAAALSLITLAWGITYAVAAPYQDRLSGIFDRMSVDLSLGLSLWVRTSWQNVLNLFTGYEATVLMRLIGLGLIAALVRELLRLRKPPQDAVYARPYWVCVVTLFILYMLAILAYDVADWRDFRILSPFVLMTVALVIAFRQWRWAVIVLVVLVVGLPFSARGHNLFIRPKADPAIHTAYTHWQAQWAGVLVYDPQALSRWCNTLYYPIDMTGFSASYEQITVLGAVPFGIGLSFYSVPLPQSIQSQWVIVRDADLPVLSQAVPLEQVLPLPSGAVYRNGASACPNTALNRETDRSR